MKSEAVSGWHVEFRRNVHMYCHLLRMTKGGKAYEIPCEDSALGGDIVAAWPYTLELRPETYRDLLDGLRKWAKGSGLKVRIYTSKDVYESNISLNS